MVNEQLGSTQPMLVMSKSNEAHGQIRIAPFWIAVCGFIVPPGSMRSTSAACSTINLLSSVRDGSCAESRPRPFLFADDAPAAPGPHFTAPPSSS